MPKQKTHKGLKKRVKVTSRGLIKRRRAGGRHLLASKNAKRKRQNRRPVVSDDTRAKKCLILLGQK